MVCLTECDRESSTMRSPWPTRAVAPWLKEVKGIVEFWSATTVVRGTRWRVWFRHCATRRKVAGSIPDVVVGIFN